jgi:protein-tyrosine phosphatase
MDHFPLADFIDKEGIIALNNTPKTCGDDVLGGADGLVYSDPDSDHQLIFRIPFTERVSLYSFRILATEKPEGKECDSAMPPHKVKLFKNTLNMDFEECSEKEATEDFELSKDQTSGMPTAVNVPRFRNIQSLTLFIESNQGNADMTFLNQITFKGKSVRGTDIDELKNNPREAVCIQIRDGLWLGNTMAASDKVLLRDHKITHCVAITTEKVDYWEQLEVKRFPMNDDPKVHIHKIFEESRVFVVNALSVEENQVLVHSTAGISRSVTIICAYLMATQHMSAKEALKYVRRKRPQANPNYGFWKQLRDLQKGLLELSID